MIYIKQISKFFVLVSLIFIGFLLGTLLTTNVLASEVDVEYTFERDVLYEEQNPEYNHTFNMANHSSYYNTGHYPATYSFENEPVGTSGTNINFVNSTIIDTTCEIVLDYSNHNKVLYFNHSGVGGGFVIFNYIDSNPTSGTVECWINNAMVQDYYIILRKDGVGDITQIRYYTKTNLRIYYGDGVGGNNYASITVVEDAWVHLKMQVDCNVSKQNVWVDNVLKVDNENFPLDSDNVDFFNQFRIYSSDGAEGYIDAIGYSWDYNATYFNSTYTFDDDIVGTEPDGWTVNNAGGCTSLIIASLDEQVNVLKMFDGTSSGSSQVYRSDVNQELNQYIEMDLGVSLISKVSYITLKYGGTSLIKLIIENNDLFYFDSGYNQYSIKNNFITNNNLFTLKIVLNDTADTWDAYIDDILELTDIPYFTASGGSVNYISFDTDYTPTGYSFYVDNIHVSSDSHSFPYIPSIVYNYEIGDNIEPIISINETFMEVDKWQFLYEGLNDKTDDGDDNPNGWTDIEYTGDWVNIRQTQEGTERAIEIITRTAEDYGDRGIQKDNFNVSSEFLNISFGFTINVWTGLSEGNIFIRVYSNDNTEIIRLTINEDFDLFYWNGTSYILLRNDLAVGVFYDFNLFVNFIVDKNILRYKANDVFLGTYEFPLIVSNKIGLKKVSFIFIDILANQEVEIEWIGVYDNGRSLTSEYGSFGIDIPTNIWEFKEHNILSLDIIGNNISVYGEVIPDEGPQEVVSIRNYNGLEIFNLYDLTYGSIDHFALPILWFYIYSGFEVNKICIEGVRLIENNNTYMLDYSSSNVDIGEGYFIVDLSNRLNFYLEVNDNNTEYIQASFNVIDIACENRSVNFRSNINGNSYGALRIKYKDDTSTYFEFPYYTTSTSIILPQKKMIEKLIIIISDNDLDDNDCTNGYVSNIKLIYYPNIGISITTLNLIAVMIPLIIMIAPPLAMSVKFGKKIIVPMFILMTLICFISSLIPIWLFFVVIFSSSAFLVVKKKTQEGEI